MAKKVQITVDINTKSGVKSIGDLNKETKQVLTTINEMEEAQKLLNEQLKNVEIGTEEYERLKTELQDVNKALKEQNEEIERLDPAQFATEIGSIASGLASTATAAYAMSDALGLTNDTTDEFIKNVGTGMAVAQSFSSGLQGIISAQKVLKSSTIANTVATKGGTVAMRIFNGVVRANPIGILITALLAAVSAFALFNSNSKAAKQNTEELEEQNAKLNKTLQEQNKIFDKNLELRNIQRSIRDSRRQLLIARDILYAENALVKLRRESPKDIDKIYKAQQRLNNLNVKMMKEQHTTAQDNLEAENLLHNERMNNAIENRRNFKKGTEEYKFWNDEYLKYADLQITFSDRQGELTLKQENELIKLRLDNANKLASIKGTESTTEEEVAEEERLNDLKFLNAQKAYDDLVLLRITHERDIALLQAENIENEREREETILGIKSSYLDKVANAIKDSSKTQLAILNEQERIELANAEDNIDEKLRIEKEYALAREQLYADTETQIQLLQNETINNARTGMAQAISDWGEDNAEMIAFIQESVTQSLDIISGFIENTAENLAAKQQEEYDRSSEAFAASLANREISQEQYDDKMTRLEQKRANQELEAKRKAFKQQKAMQITNAIMQTAQAVLAAFSSAAAVPIAGIALGPIMAGVAGALGAAQIAVISSQKFKAARGGIVPGNGPGHIDSVEALLAPGEAVINSRSAAMFPQTLSKINEAGGGISLAPEPLIGNDSPTQTPIFANNNEQTIKAVVVESDITESQKRISRIERSAEF